MRAGAGSLGVGTEQLGAGWASVKLLVVLGFLLVVFP